MTDTTNGHGPAATAPSSVRAMDGAEAAELAGLASVFEDLQYVLRCCEHLVTALNAPGTGPLQVQTDPALVEALWTGALVGYVRCFSGQAKVLTDNDLRELELEGEVIELHAALKKLRDAFASRHVNPRESFTIGAAQGPDGRATGIAVTTTPTPTVDDSTVRLLGRIAYALSGLVDARMQRSQNAVLTVAAAMSPEKLGRLPEVHLTSTA